VGDNVTISDHVTLIARGEKGITLSDGVRLQDRVYLDTERVEEGYITVGKGVYIGTGTTLFGHRGLEIGDDCLLAQGINLTPYSHIFDDPSRIIYSQGGHCEKVTIGNDVYIGMGCKIMYSGNIGEGSVIGCGSTVVKPIPPYSVAVGSPAKVIKERK
jgi:galactoside O-acetyltransferase